MKKKDIEIKEKKKEDIIKDKFPIKNNEKGSNIKNRDASSTLDNFINRGGIITDNEYEVKSEIN